jgi:hypothetical protein
MTDKFLSFKNLIRRLLSASPSYFKKLRSLGLACTGLGLAYAGLSTTLPSMFTPDDGIMQVAKYLMIVGATIAAVSTLTVADNSAVDPAKKD